MIRFIRSPNMRLIAFLALPLSFVGEAAKADGTLNAVSYFPIEASSSFEVRTLDNSTQNLKLVESMKQALRLKGRGIQEGSQFVLTIEPSDEIGSYTSSKRPVVSITGESSPSSEDNAQVRLNLFDSQSGAILNEGAPGKGSLKPSEYALLVRVEDRTNGRQHWEGWASAAVRGGDRSTLLEMMIRPLANAVGKTIKQQPLVTE